MKIVCLVLVIAVLSMWTNVDANLSVFDLVAAAMGPDGCQCNSLNVETPISMAVLPVNFSFSVEYQCGEEIQTCQHSGRIQKYAFMVVIMDIKISCDGSFSDVDYSNIFN